jgi:hypothetical protein
MADEKNAEIKRGFLKAAKLKSRNSILSDFAPSPPYGGIGNSE